ncbi:MAG: hypothetical protein ACJAT2_001150 [Bacteriovoracaceae bacterium]|jgi:hypothetical protein
MKGTFFKQPLEFSVDIKGESHRQGESLKGSLLVRNHSDEELALGAYGVTLAQTDAKKLKAKNEKGITNKHQLSFKEDEKLGPKDSATLEWEFKIPSDGTISEKSNGPYIYYGATDELFEGGFLELSVLPIEILEKYIEIFENFFRFKRKSLKNKAGFIDIQYTCPGGKDYARIEKLNQRIRIIDSKLEVKWLFKVNKLGYESGSVVEEKVERNFDQLLEKKRFMDFGDFPNQDGILASIEEVLEQVKKYEIF